MPRPGPRPYECVRRAWHSDRHQPIRGSLIQEIFRLANEVHCKATRKNKEWQEKLPFVVLKAEEIMYSKANSEAEYMDSKTLWDRANDAIDTIIRKDDANESGDLLQPCIEAALNLGCTPLRASRSQRHSNPVCYLSPNLKEPTDLPPKHQDNNKAYHLCPKSMLQPPLLPIHSGDLHGSAPQFAPKSSASGHEIQFMPSKARGFPTLMESCVWPDIGCVYPLYYGQEQMVKNTRNFMAWSPNESDSNSMAPRGHTKPSVQSNGTELIIIDASDGLDRVHECKKKRRLARTVECDLSLRLGLPSPPRSEVESSWAHEVEDVGSSSSCELGKSCQLLLNGSGKLESSHSDKGFDFFECSSKLSSQRDCAIYTNSCDKNQKVYASTDDCFSWKP